MVELGILDKELQALRVLNKNNVEYLLIGGFAMRYHGAGGRETTDVDLFTNNAKENATKLHRSIEEIIGKRFPFEAKRLENPRALVRFKSDGIELEVLMGIEGLLFDVANKDRVLTLEKGIVIPVISKDHLLLVKKLSVKDQNRSTKDQKDIEFLESV